MDTHSIEQKIIGLLFYKSAPVKKSFLCQFFSVQPEELEDVLARMRETMTNQPLVITDAGNEVELVTAPRLGEMIEALRNDELKSDIGKSGAEALSIILYRGPVSRSEIDRIRGVNSSYILRNLLIRGLIEKTQSKNATIRYVPTTALLNTLGIKHRNELPNYSDVLERLDIFEQQTDVESTV